MESRYLYFRRAAFYTLWQKKEGIILALREIILEGNATLRGVAHPVSEINEHIHQLLDDMAETMYNANGVGLAAPQVSVRRRVVVIDIGEGLIELINPEIISQSEELQRNIEGCLSVPDQNGYVDRPIAVQVRAQNREGVWIEYTAEDYLAIAMCHEIDHLDGILYVDKVLDLTEEELEELRLRDAQWEEVEEIVLEEVE